MDDYVIDRETLGKFIDELIRKKPLPVNSAEELNNLREESIKSLDDKIAMAIFGKFTGEQNESYQKLLDEDNPPEVYQNFFKESGLDLEKIITEAMQEFSTEFLGEQNV